MKIKLLLFFLLLSTAISAQSYKVGDPVSIEWNGKWYSGKILEVAGDGYKISYDGYGAEWNEKVTAARLKPNPKSDKIPPVNNNSNSTTTTSTTTNTEVSTNTSTGEASFKGVETIWDIQPSADGKYIIAASAYGNAKILNASDLTLVKEIKISERPVFSVSLSYTGEYLAAGDGEGKFIIYKNSGNMEFTEYMSYKEYSSVGKIKFSPNSNDLIVCAAPKKDYTMQYVDVWNVDEKKIKYNLLSAKGADYVTGEISFPKDGSKVALAISNNKKGIEIFDLTTGKQSMRIETKTDMVAVAFSPDGGILASGGTDKMVTLWNLSNKTQIWTNKWNEGADAYLYSLAFAPNGMSIAACGSGSGPKIKLFALASGKVKSEIGGSNPNGNAVCFSVNSDKVYVALTTYGDFAKVPIVYMSPITK